MSTRPSYVIAAFAAGAIASATALSFATNHRPASAAAARPPVISAQSHLDTLRAQAESGDAFSNYELTLALLNRYDLTSDSDDLYEAMVWFDRRWEATGSAELAPRVFAKYCAQRVLRWHKLCVMGE